MDFVVLIPAGVWLLLTIARQYRATCLELALPSHPHAGPRRHARGSESCPYICSDLQSRDRKEAVSWWTARHTSILSCLAA